MDSSEHWTLVVRLIIDMSSKTSDIFNRHDTRTLFVVVVAEMDKAGNIYKQAIFISKKKKKKKS